MRWPWISDFVDGRRRAVDLRLLWPVCKREARSLDDARMAFLMHAMADEAWARHYTETELLEFVRGLE